MVLFLLAASGWGCRLGNLPFSNEGTETTTSTVSFGSSAVEAAKAIQFMPGDTFEVRQTVLGFGAFLPDLFQSKNGVRTVTLTRFAPMNTANFSWNVTVDQETAASIKARAEYDKEVASHPRAIGEAGPVPPVPQMETVTVTGTVMEASLKSSHAAFLPAYWGQGVKNLENEKSGIWLSQDAFDELVRTRHTILNLGVFDSEANQAARNVSELKSAIDKLRKQANEDGKFKDLTLLEAEPDFIEWPLQVNGKTVNVSAIRAKNWFGEVVILNSAQNPMILKVTLNPLAAGASDALGGNTDVLSKMYGYEVSNIQIKR